MSGKTNAKARGSKGERAAEAPAAAADAAIAGSDLDAADILASIGGLDGDEDSSDFNELQKALERVIKSKSQKATQKQSAILVQLQASVAASVKSLEQGISQDSKAVEQLATKKFDGISKQLQAKFDEVVALNQKYQQDLHQRWEQYQELYSQLETARSEVVAAVDKRKAALRRKVGQAEQEAAERLHAAQAKISKCKTQASKLPGLAKMLKAFI